MPSLGDWEYSNDRAATEGAYTQAGPSGAEACNCNTCRNYVAVRQRVLPLGFVTFLHSVGIDPMKEAEAYHLAQLTPGCHSPRAAEQPGGERTRLGILNELREPVEAVLLALETQHTEDGSIDGARVTLSLHAGHVAPTRVRGARAQ